jgi:broad specificity phosphatase PhoE
MVAAAASRSLRFGADAAPPAPTAAPPAGIQRLLAEADRVLASPSPAVLRIAGAWAAGAAEEPALADCDFGRWAGLEPEVVAIRDPQGFAAWASDPEAAPHGGESLAAFVRRVGLWMDGQLGQDGRAVCLVPQAVLRAAILHTLSAPPAALFRVDVEPAAIARFTADGRRWAFRLRGR